MGLFDFFKGKGAASGDAQEKTLMRHAERVLDKRAMSPDRFASIEYLCRLGTEEAWRALLPRYNFTVDPTITDREEKAYILESISKAGDAAVGPVKEYLLKANAVNWPIKMLRALVSEEQFVGEMAAILKNEDTNYQKNPERKIQAIVALEEVQDPRIAAAVLPFLDDVSEDTRFYAVRTLLAQDAPETADALLELLARDDSMRIKTTLADGLLERGWPCGEAAREKAAPVLPRLPNGPFSFDPEGALKRAGRR